MRAMALPLRRPVGTGAVYALLLLLGVGAAADLPISLAPAVEEPALLVRVAWPDASPRLVAAEVTTRLEEIAEEMPAVVGVRSRSVRGLSEVEIRFEPGTRVDRSEVLLRDRIVGLRSLLPAEIGVPEILPLLPPELDQGTFFVLRASAPRSAASLQAELEDRVLPSLLAVPGVAGGAVYGGPRDEIRVDLDPGAAGIGRIDAPRARRALSEVGGTQAIGAGQRDQFSLPFVWRRSAPDAAAVAAQVVDQAGSRPVRLGEVARVAAGWEEPRRLSRVDGQAAVQIVLERAPGTNVLTVAREVRAMLPRAEATLGPGASLDVLHDQSETLGRELRSLCARALFSILAILIVLLVAERSWRAGAIVTLSLVFSALASFILFRLAGLGLDLVTLAGITLAFGMAVDNSIVVFENAQARAGSGLRVSAMVRILAATREVLFPLLAAAATTAVVLLPFLYLGGSLRRFYVPFALSVVLSLTASLVVALTLTPLLTHWALASGGDSWLAHRIRSLPVAQGITHTGAVLRARAERWFVGSLEPGLRRPWLSILPAFLLFALSLWVFREEIDRGSYFPPGGDSGVRVGLLLPRGTPTAVTDALVRDFETLLLAHPFRSRGLLAHVEAYAADNSGGVHARLHPAAVGTVVPQVLQDLLTERAATLSGVDVSVSGYGPGFSSGSSQVTPSYQLRLAGPDFLRLEALAADLGERLARHPRVRDVDTNAASWQASGETELVVLPDDSTLDRLGVSRRELEGALTPLLAGDLSRTRLRSETGEVLARLRWSDGTPLEPASLARTFLTRADGTRIGLADLVSIEERPVQAEILRRDQRYERLLSFDFRGPRRVGNRYVESFLAGTDLPSGYTVEDGLTFRLREEEEREVLAALLFALALVFLVAAALFESFVLPFVALLSVPLSFIGIVALFWANGDPFDRTAYVGLVLLTGIAINNALLFVHRAGRLRARGLPPMDAARRAVRERARPILLTTATSVAGLVPLSVAAEAGAGDAWRALALSASAGLVASAVATLWVVPPLFTLLSGWAARGAIRRGLHPANASANLSYEPEPGGMS